MPPFPAHTLSSLLSHHLTPHHCTIVTQLKVGNRIVSVNGASMTGKLGADVHAAVKAVAAGGDIVFEIKEVFGTSQRHCTAHDQSDHCTAALPCDMRHASCPSRPAKRSLLGSFK